MTNNTRVALFGGRTEYPVEAYKGAAPRYDVPDQAHIVYIVVQAQAYALMLALFEQWFANREEVEIVDHGTSDKQQEPFLVVEWFENEIDQLFLDILDTEPTVIDYTTYTREVD